MSTELQTVLVETDNLINDLLHPKAWLGTLPFKNCIICTKDDNVATGSFQTTDVDLFDYCKLGKKANFYSKSHIVRFDPSIYPVEQSMKQSHEESMKQSHEEVSASVTLIR